MDSITSLGLTADRAGQPAPNRSRTPGRKFSTTTSQAAARSSSRVTSPGWCRSSTIERLPALTCEYSPERPRITLPNACVTSVPGSSARTTSAPRSARIRPASGPDTARDRSSTRRPSRGLVRGRGRCVMAGALVRPGQAEDVLGEVVEDHLLRDRGDAHQPGLAPVALDVVLAGVAEPAVGLHGRVGGGEAGLGGKELGQVGLLPRGQVVVDSPGRLADGEFGRGE